jgi:hypothetical protein
MRSKLTIHGFHTRNTQTEFRCVSFAPPRLNLRHRHTVWGVACAGVPVTAVGMVRLTGGTSCIDYRLGVGFTTCASTLPYPSSTRNCLRPSPAFHTLESCTSFPS